MTNINEKVLQQLMRLSRLQLNEEEKTTLISSLEELVDYIGIVQKIECDHSDFEDEQGRTEEMTMESLREDVPQQEFSREEFLLNVPDHVAGLVKVPTVIKN